MNVYFLLYDPVPSQSDHASDGRSRQLAGTGGEGCFDGELL